MNTTTTKKCTTCHEVKPLEEFTKDRNSKDKKARWCKQCASIQLQNTHSKRKNRTEEQLDDDLRRLRPGGMKKCLTPECGEHPLSQFGRDIYRADGKMSWCNKCQEVRREQAKLRRQAK